MAGGKELLLLAAFLSLVKCQQIPKVFMFPNMTHVFMGDLLLLKCKDSSRASVVIWTLNGKELKSKNETLRIAAASLNDSGSYKCEINGQKSDDFPVNVLEYAPTASLIIKTGHPVMETSMPVILRLENDEGLKGWSCRVMRGEKTNRIKLIFENNPVSWDFQTSPLLIPETIFWCVDKTGSRSNQVVVRTSDKIVSLEMYPMPAVAGESLTLKCLVRGTNKIFRSTFYKDGSSVKQVQGSEIYTIQNITESQVGKYSCDATYKNEGQTVPNPFHDTSDPQDVPLYVSPVKAELSEDMHCSCPRCDSSMSYRYYKKTGDSWTMLNDAPKDSGTYQCRAVMEEMRTLPSRSVTYNPFPLIIVVMIVLLLLLGLIVTIVACIMFKKRRDSGAVYEDVGLRLQGGAKDPEYDTIQPVAAGSREKQGGEYQALKKGEVSEYHTLGMEGASGGEGGYQELKKGEVSEYHTLGMEGASGGEGGYQELKKGQQMEEVYQKLGDHVEAGKDHYECLKKEGIQKEEYETLQTEERKPDRDIDVVEEIDENK